MRAGMRDGGGVVEVGAVTLVRNRHVILKDISFSVREGEMIGIIGPNGAGKTTLLRVMLGLIRPSSGTVRVMGRRAGAMGRARDLIGYVPQRPLTRSSVPLSVLDVVCMGAVTGGILGRRFPRDLRRRAEACLYEVCIHHLRHRPFESLSGGERQRALLARALCKDPRILLLDEPNAGLDIAAQRRLFDRLEELRRSRPVTVIVVSHDIAAIASAACRLVCINRTMHVHGRPSEVLTSPGLETAYRCEFDLLVGTGRR